MGKMSKELLCDYIIDSLESEESIVDHDVSTLSA